MEEKRKQKREEILNYRSKIGQEAFRKETDENEDLLNVFKNQPTQSQIQLWKQIFDDILKNVLKRSA